jgi:chaperonin GroES
MAKTASTKSTASFRPLHDKILIKRDTAESKTAAGIYLPEKAKDTPKTGVIEAVGTGTINHDTGDLIPLTVKKGQRVLFSSYSGTELKFEGEDMLVMSEDEILAIIEG